VSVTVGKRVPDFTARGMNGDFKLSAHTGRKIVLYFYPKDNTPGCTTQASDFRDQHGAFEAAGALIVGVSRDSLKSHQNFRDKFELPFELLSDPEEALCNAFEVMKTKNMYGKQVRGIERSTFLIGADGVLVQQWRGVKVPGHVAEVLEAVRSA
jgi:thioredoxin-dependent peroxiredoxin